MIPRWTKKWLFGPGLLVLWLVTGQALALAHQSDFELHDNGEACEVCLFSQALDDGEVDLGSFTPPVTRSTFQPPHAGLIPCAARLNTCQARAPPSQPLI